MASYAGEGRLQAARRVFLSLLEPESTPILVPWVVLAELLGFFDRIWPELLQYRTRTNICDARLVV